MKRRLIRNRNATALRWSSLAMAFCILGGCARMGERPGPFRREPPPTAEALLAPLKARAQPVKTLWLRANAAIGRRGRPGKAVFQATLLAEPPDRLRLRAFRNSTILVLDVRADGTGVRAHDAMQKRYYASTYDVLRRTNSPWAGFSSALLIQALAVEQTVLTRAATARSARVRRHWGTWELELDLPEGQAHVFFDRKRSQIESLIWKQPDGGSARIAYGPMTEIEGVRLPEWIELRHDPSRMHLRLHATEYKVNSDFDPRWFVFEAPAGKSWLPLEMMNLGETDRDLK